MNNPVNRREYDGHSGAVIDRPNLIPLILPLSGVGSGRAYTKAKGGRVKTRKSRAFGRGRDRDTASPAREKAGVVHKVIIRSHLRVDYRFYWFRKQTRINLILSASDFIAKIGHGGNFFITGRGRSERKAVESLSVNVDREIQRLYRCLPMQLSDDEQKALKALGLLFDLDRFRKTVKATVIELARFSRDNGQLHFECFGGPDIIVASGRCSGFDNVRVGDWCEIDVIKWLQDATVDSVQLRRIVNEPRSLSDDEVRRELSELPKADFPILPDGPIRST